MTVLQQTPSGEPSVAALRPPEEYLLDRGQEAAELVDLILASSRFVVLYGAPDSGKTLLLTHWVIPKLCSAVPADVDVLYGDCRDTFPDAFSGRSGIVDRAAAFGGSHVVVADHFERLLDLPRERQRAELDSLFRSLQEASKALRIVLVTDERKLNDVYALASYDPAAIRVVRELRALTVREALTGLGSLRPEERVEYPPDVATAIADECMELSARCWSDTLPLVRVVHAWAVGCCRESQSVTVTFDAFESAGRVRGILRAHLERHLDAVEAEQEGDGNLARALLEQFVETYEQGDVPDAETLGARVGIDKEKFDRLTERLRQPGGLLREKAGGFLRVVPAQMLVLLEDGLKTRASEVQRAKRIVLEGYRAWERSGVLLSPRQFDEVHAQRRQLRPDAEQARFLLHCALLQGNGSDSSASYWLRRVSRREDRLTVLLLGILHDSPSVRVRSAKLLGGFDEPEAVERLCSVALADLDATVRAAATEALGRVKTDGVKEAILREVESRESPHRLAALEALRIFPDADVAATLKRELDDTGAALAPRRAAVRVLAALPIIEAVDALIDVALYDPDEEDRQAAAVALASVTKPDLIRRIFARVNASRRPWRWVARITLGVLALFSLVVGLFAFVTLLGAGVGALSGYLLFTTAMMVPTAWLMRRLRASRRGLASIAGVSTVVLFTYNALTILPLVHGLAHYAIGRRRHAAFIAGIEGLSLLFVFALWPTLAATPGLEWLGWVYLVAGILMFVGSYFYDVLEAFIGAVALRRATMLRDQRTAVYEQLFTNPIAAGLACDALTNGDAKRLPSAGRLLKRFGKRVPPGQLVAWLQDGNRVVRHLASRALRGAKGDGALRALQTAWTGADRQLRGEIAEILWRTPSARSLELLDSVRPQLSRLQRARVGIARFVYRVVVWPPSVRVAAVAILPTIGILLYDGWRVHANPVWPQIVALRKPDIFARPGHKVKLVGFVAELYPAESAADLFDLLENTSEVSDLELHAALVRAVASLEPSVRPQPEGQWRPTLERAIGAYDSLLLRGDTLARKVALDVFEHTIAAPDSLVADATIESLVRFVGSPSDAPDERRFKRRAITALAALPYPRALPILDSLMAKRLRERPNADPFVADNLRQELERVSVTATTGALSPDSVDARNTLREVLRPLRSQTRLIRRQLAALDSLAAASAPGRCDRTGDGRCDFRDEVLVQIEDDPTSEFSYTDLVAHYNAAGDIHGAVDALKNVIRERPWAVWPRKTLAYVLHERIAPTDTSAFRQSYEVMQRLRALQEYRTLRDSAMDDYARSEMDFVEIAFSARQYQETDSLAQRLLSPRGLTGVAYESDPTRRLNAALFAYMSAVMAGNSLLAVARLEQLKAVIDSLPRAFDNKWLYPGTTAFIERADLPRPLREALLKLCKAGHWYSRTDAAAVLELNRDALQWLGKS
jgi:hypothetical protein